ncbi:hypothetical protein MPER_14499 [Moniliophthora perniciosa FA553]|nr:hypothetical protein MPER_14499 [Moniliophthora perniciosa FA553]
MDEDEEDEAGDILGEMQAGSSSQSEDNSVQAFPNHQTAVFTVAVHPSEPLAVSGGEDELAIAGI